MKKLLIPLLFMPFLAQAKDIAIAPNGMMGITVLTNEACVHNPNLFVSYTYNSNKTIIYACWKVEGDKVVFSHSIPQLRSLLVNQFIKPPQ